MPRAFPGILNPAAEPASAGNPPTMHTTMLSGCAEPKGFAYGGDRESVQRLQLEMLKRENAELGSKLETLAQQLRSSELAGIDHNLESSESQRESLDRELCPVPAVKKQKKVPRVKEVLLVFEGDLQTCCRETISTKLLHLKRLLYRRLEARLSPTPEALNSLFHVLLSAQRITAPSSQERLRVQASVALPDEACDTLRRQILSVVSFTLGADLPEDSVTFVELQPEAEILKAEEFQRPRCPQVSSRPSHVQVVITAFNNGTHDQVRIPDSVLSELCESESSGGRVSWARFMGKYVNVGYVNKDMARLGQDERTVVCSSSSSKQCGSISLYYPTHLESFFTDRALRDTLEPGALLHSLLAEHIDSIHFEEWRAGSILVPARMAEWIAADLCMLVATIDPWLGLLQHAPHIMTGIKIDSWCCSVSGFDQMLQEEEHVHDAVVTVTESQEATVALFFHQERQQEVLRRKMVGLDGILRCKLLVNHVEAHVSRLKLQAEALCGLLNWENEDAESSALHQVCCQLRHLSSECETSIDVAMDAIQAVSEETKEGVIHLQLTKVLRARTAKQQVERLRDQCAGALKQQQQQQRSHHQQQQQQQQQQRSGDRSNRSELGALEREGGREHVAVVEQERGTGRGLGRLCSEWIQEEECGRGESGVGAFSPSSRGGGGVGNMLAACEGTAAVAVVEAGGAVGTTPTGAGVASGRGGGGGVSMVKEFEDGLQAHREQQHKLVRLWLDQHEVMRCELQRLVCMANTEGSSDFLGLVALQTRFQEYVVFLEEHEAVEDTMLFPMVKALFPQSAKDLDRILDPERHNSVDAVNAGVGRLLQQLHDRQIALNEMSLSSQMRRDLVAALERVNDYMVGHMRYEEEATMPWLSQASGAPTGLRRPPIAV